jgi:subtilase family serine protease
MRTVRRRKRRNQQRDIPANSDWWRSRGVDCGWSFHWRPGFGHCRDRCDQEPGRRGHRRVNDALLSIDELAARPGRHAAGREPSPSSARFREQQFGLHDAAASQPACQRHVLHHCETDADGTAPETSETNNTNYRQILIGGDLVVSSFTVPVKGGPGSALTISDTTTNQGAGAIGSSLTKFYLSTNGSYDSADTLLRSRAVPDLAGGATSTASTTVIIPSNATAGTYNVIARADADAGTAETNELNNNAARSVTIGSDLVVGVPSTTAIKAAAGSSLDFSETVTNQGGGSSTPSVTRYYLSSNSTLSADDMLLEGGRAVPGLAAGGSSTGSTSLLLPAGVAAGLSYIIAKADGDDTVNETSETNNTASRAVSIGPDLIVSATSAPSSAAAGTAINVSNTVLNQGTDGAAATVTRFYLRRTRYSMPLTWCSARSAPFRALQQVLRMRAQQSSLFPQRRRLGATICS